MKALFQAYYHEIPLASLTPVDLPKREFGFIIPDKKGMIRHKAFVDAKDYKAFLVQNVPIHAYYSATLYNSPWKDRMDLKDYTGCDLIFDIDCDHIDTPCKQEHDTWTCKECGQHGTGKVPEKCPSCNANSFEEKSWLCDECLTKAKSETVKLIDDFLAWDFGLPPDSTGIYFSGQRGFHVHLEGEKFRTMATDERREFADYITATGISLPSLGFNSKGSAITGFTIKDPGWRGKIATRLLRLLDDLGNDTDTSALSHELQETLKMDKGVLEQRLKNKDPNWTLKKIGDAKWNSIMNFIIADIKCEIDVPVTIDIHRLIRAPNTLHGKTGFKNMKLTRDQLTTFDPFTDAVAFKGNEERIKMLGDVPRFRIEDRNYGPYAKDDIETMSLGAAVFLMCKNLGVVA
ncbi:MAG TPA: DNA primase small subunit domain-containing protein [Candidatus Lokiarchaeia archaeon]|nr:DNA primase small subunit domain-containing protein [Candidatus Lokiarchaeia archaeon]